MSSRLRIGVLGDPAEENWPSMDLACEMLLSEWRGTFSEEVDATEVNIAIPRLVRRVPGLTRARLGFNLDRIAARFVTYPARALLERRHQQFFHVVDHSYAQLVHVLPQARTGVYCHDLDAFRSIISPSADPRPAWYRALMRSVMRGLQKAAVVFHNTVPVRDELVRHGIVSASRLVHAPFGVSPEFVSGQCPGDDTGDDMEGVLRDLCGAPFVLHVGSSIPRKRIDLLFEVFARLHSANPKLRLVQQGGELTTAQRAHADRLGIQAFVIQPPKLTRKALAALYRRAAAVLLPSDAEGFGFPVLEGLACGAVVIATDLPALREVGGDAAIYCPPGDIDAWAHRIDGLLTGKESPPSLEVRLRQAGRFTWARHARTILNAYQALDARPKVP